MKKKKKKKMKCGCGRYGTVWDGLGWDEVFLLLAKKNDRFFFFHVPVSEMTGSYRNRPQKKNETIYPLTILWLVLVLVVLLLFCFAQWKKKSGRKFPVVLSSSSLCSFTLFAVSFSLSLVSWVQGRMRWTRWGGVNTLRGWCFFFAILFFHFFFFLSFR